MRVSDDRYDKDRLRFDLALRMVGYGARARTIRTWTGLSNDRLRKLCRAYMLPRPQRSLYRIRPKIPHEASCFLKSSTLGFEATTLASLFYIMGLVPCNERSQQPATPVSPLWRAETLCQAYDIFLALYPAARLTFEHSGFLLDALLRRAGVKLSVCGRCQRLYLADVVRVESSTCGCGPRRLALPRRRRLSVRTRPMADPPPLEAA